MTSEEKVTFLKKMGYGGSILRTAVGLPASEPPKERKKPTIFKYNMDDLYHVYKIFNLKKESTCLPQTRD